MTRPRLFPQYATVVSLCLLALAALSIVVPSGQAQTVYTSVPGSSAVVVIDGSTNKVVASIAIPLPPGAPAGSHSTPSFIALTPDAKSLYVLDKTGGIDIVDTATNTVTSTIPVSGSPWEIAFSPDGLKGYFSITGGLTGSLSIIDTSTHNVTTALSNVPYPGTAGMAMTSDGGKVYLGLRQGLGIYDTASGTMKTVPLVIPSFPGGAPIFELAVTPDGTQVFVSIGAQIFTAPIYTFVPASGLFSPVVGHPIQPCTPGEVSVTPDGNNAFVGDAECGGITQVATASDTATSFSLPDPRTATSQYFVFTADSRIAYAASGYDSGLAASGNVQVFDVNTHASLAVILVGQTSAYGIAIVPLAAATTTTLSSSPNPAISGQAVTLTATVASAVGIPTGAVTFTFGNSILGTVPLTPGPGANSGTAAFTTSALPTGADALTASYGGDPKNSPSSGALTLAVDNTPVGINVPVQPVDAGTGTAPVFLSFAGVTQPGITTLTITSNGPAPQSGFQLGNPPVYYNLATTAVYGGNITICINYAGVTFTQPPQLFHFQNGAWANITTSVNPATTTVCGLSPSLSPFALFQSSGLATTTAIAAPGIKYGTPGSVTVSVASSSGPATGSVQLSVDGSAASSAVLLNGSATFSVGFLSVGSHSLSASFPAQGNFLASLATGTLGVAQETTSLAVTFAPATIPVGQSTTATITLTAPDMVIPIDPSVLAPITVTSPIASDILSNNGACTPIPGSAPGTAVCTVTITSIEPNGRTLNVSFAGSASLAASSTTGDLIVTASLLSQNVCIRSDFRNVAVAGGNAIWFNSIFKVRDLDGPKQKVNISFFNSSFQFQYQDTSGNLVSVNQAMPNAHIVIDPTVSVASTSFDAVNNVWITTIPWDLDDSAFLTGMPWTVPAGGIPGDVEPVTVCGTFASDAANLDLGWRWAAAAYSTFNTDTSVLGVKPMDTDHDNHRTPSSNHDRAGTPENYKQFVIPGARGKGGRNYTGSYSGSAVIE